MSTAIKPQSIVLASGNAGKIREFQQLLGEYHISIKPQSEFNVPSVDETGLTFVENAILKARHACEHTGLAAIADDSGLAVDALNGAPGIYSARYSESGNDADNNAKLITALADIPEAKRGARFICALAFMRHAEDPTPILAIGQWYGRILEAPCGENGFGYDPLFYVPTHHCASAQLDKAEKNAISHRGMAMSQLLDGMRNAQIIR
ncbi:RdgB/HAM1 family non-canonical purine NTP pyrophosphatase [Marinibactrum halimedae]|uniref:dITP/XTP pyrophosphatase n=1 Tax=Marinibactrum halimedae TaxID=1444977 RepID=A0AA37T904_9GAMM|nr:RdgB/HAM1 family non-canonical purine NTP pyrophosphatase [Marinibactrum halimedae]MCD9458311.1 RdgB/HAM1 family non-canonical purine NTP pyrophosphatase [Marinibactrum halimedae]GLS27062.1 non-canonical purine NTP pyrophosphatase [Marinibactrum halimedae]